MRQPADSVRIDSFQAALFCLLIAAVVLSGTSIADAACNMFRRGDADADGNVDADDATEILDCLFYSTCGPQYASNPDAYDANDDGVLNISDSIFILNGSTPPAPSTPCLDPTPDNINLCCDVENASGSIAISSGTVVRTSIAGFTTWPVGTPTYTSGTKKLEVHLTADAGECDEPSYANKLRYRWEVNENNCGASACFTKDQLQGYVSSGKSYGITWSASMTAWSSASGLCDCEDALYDYYDNRFNIYSGNVGQWKLEIKNKTTGSTTFVIVSNPVTGTSDPFCIYEHKAYVEDDECNCESPDFRYCRCRTSCVDGTCLNAGVHPTGCSTAPTDSWTRTMANVSISASNILSAISAWNTCDELAITSIELDGWTARLYHQAADGDLSQTEEFKISVTLTSGPSISDACN